MPAERTKMSTVVPPGGPAYRDQMGTLVDEEELEAARLASMRSIPPQAAASTPSGPAPGPLAQAQQLAIGGDDAGALALINRYLDHPPAGADMRLLAEDYRRALLGDAGRIASLAKVPRLVVPRERLTSFALDPRSGFLLGFVDGLSSIEMIVDMSGFSLSDVLGAFANLHERAIVALRD